MMPKLGGIFSSLGQDDGYAQLDQMDGKNLVHMFFWCHDEKGEISHVAPPTLRVTDFI